MSNDETQMDYHIRAKQRRENLTVKTLKAIFAFMRPKKEKSWEGGTETKENHVWQREGWSVWCHRNQVSLGF